MYLNVCEERDYRQEIIGGIVPEFVERVPGIEFSAEIIRLPGDFRGMPG